MNGILHYNVFIQASTWFFSHIGTYNKLDILSPFCLWSSLHKHKYTHNKPDHICDHCGKSFYFKSQYESHIQKHLKTPSFQCMHKGCGKWFKQSGELKAHLIIHSGDMFYYEEKGCAYSTNDLRNLHAHLWSHRKELPSKCKYCDNGHH